MRSLKIAAIPADGIGPEVITAGLQVLEALGQRMGDLSFDVTTFDWGSDYYKANGTMMPEDGPEQLKGFDAIFFGAVGAPDVPDHITLWGLRLPICQGFDQYANVRPTRILPGIPSPLQGKKPGDLDWVIVRENSEGEYSGAGGRVHRGLSEEVATEVSIFTRAGVARVMRYAFKLAQSRPRKLLTVVTKSNAQRHGMVLWDEIAAEVSQDFPDVTWDKMLVDAMTVRMTLKPESLDTIVATNLHAGKTLVPATNDASCTQGEYEWVATINRAVKFFTFIFRLTRVIKPPRVMHNNLLARIRGRAVALYYICNL